MGKPCSSTRGSKLITACYAVLLGRNIYVGAGYKGRNLRDSAECYRLDGYNLTTHKWNPFPVITPYSVFALAVLDEKLIIIAGGMTKKNEESSSLNDGKWKDCSEMPTARSSPTAVVYHSILIVVGGQNQVGNPLAICH